MDPLRDAETMEVKKRMRRMTMIGQRVKKKVSIDRITVLFLHNKEHMFPL